MVIKFLKLFTWKEALAFTGIILFIPVFLNNMTFIEMIFYANYPTIIVNNFILILAYKKVGLLNNISNFIVLRRGKWVSKLIVYLYSIFIILSGTFILYIFSYILSKPMNFNEIQYLLRILPINIILLLIEALIIGTQFKNKKNILFIILPILINMGVHYIVFF